MSNIVQISAEDYHADPSPVPSLSNSIANILLTRSPYHAWLSHPKLNPNFQPDESSRFDLGSAAHAMLLESDATKICVIDAPDWRTKKAKEERDQARANGLLPILAKHDYAVKKMVNAAHAFLEQSELRGILQDGDAEQTLMWEDDGVHCRSRLDWMTSDNVVILDYKTTEVAAPDFFIRQIGRMGYDLQAAFYTRGVHVCTGANPTFVFLAQEIDAPYACSLVSLSNAYIEVAMQKYRTALQTWKECMESGKWPTYPTRICYAEPPAWALREYEEEQITNPFKGDE